MTQAAVLAQMGSNNTTFRNRIINGAMMIDQRNAGASVTPTTDGQYTIDRWALGLSQASKFSIQQTTTAPVGFVNSLKATVLSAVTVGVSDYFFLLQSIEGFNIADLGWGTANAKTVTLSFQVYSSLTGTFGGAIYNQNNGAPRSYPFTYTISSANTWTTISVTIAGDTSGSWATNNSAGMTVRFGLGAGSNLSGTAGAWAGSNLVSATGATSVVGTNGATFYITGVQLEAGTNATPFEYRPYGTELALCQRYFQLNGRYTTNNPLLTSVGVARTGYLTFAYANHQFIVPMRSAPTIAQGGNLVGIRFNGAGYSTDGIATSTGVTGEAVSTTNCSVRIERASGSWSAGDMVSLSSSDATGFVSFSAEL